MAINLNQIKNIPEGDETVKSLIKQQNELLINIYKQTEKTRKYILFGRIVNALYLLLIVGLGITLLPPLVKNVVGPYQELLNTSNNLNNINVDSLNSQSINDLLEIFGTKQ